MATLYNISSSAESSVEYPGGFWSQGFRPFFFGGCLFSALAMFWWALVYSGQLSFSVTSVSSLQWHAHQMIFGYSFAIVAGFLLTAVPNWTTTKPVSGTRLFLVFGCWTAARLFSFSGVDQLFLCAVFDALFALFLLVFTAEPVIKTRSWGQCGVLSKVLLLAACNLGFYLQGFGISETTARIGIYGGLYLIVGLILTISARVYPNFVRIGLNTQARLDEPKWLGPAGIFLFLLFFINELFFQEIKSSSILAIFIFLTYSYRLFIWYVPGIWSKVLLWSLYFSVAAINLGFLFIALEPISGISRFIAIHCMAVGGIGFATSGFMARVSLGHSGKSVHHPSKYLIWVLRLLLLTLFFRILMPLLFSSDYAAWILISQFLWIAAFLIFVLIFRKMWFAGY